MEILYSTTIISFLNKVKRLARGIISTEMGLYVGRSRFTVKGLSYPLHFVVFDHPSKLGTFDPHLYEIGINKVFLLEKDEAIKEVLRHELAHYITMIEYGENVPSHGKEFRKVCNGYGWPSKISRATVPLEKQVKNKRIVDKVRKLLSLSGSPNPAEARQATLKAQELLSKYNIEMTPDEEETVLIRVLEKKQGSAKLQAIASILCSFFVYPVFNRGKAIIYLEIIGDSTATQIAEYVAHFLDHQFEALWKEAQKEDPHLKGLASKNSFFRGLAEGYKAKHSNSKALIRVENQLIEIAKKIYPHLSSMTSTFKHHEQGAKKGREKGKSLSIREGIQRNAYQRLLAKNAN